MFANDYISGYFKKVISIIKFFICGFYPMQGKRTGIREELQAQHFCKTASCK
jgi:hypothetical protein